MKSSGHPIGRALRSFALKMGVEKYSLFLKLPEMGEQAPLWGLNALLSLSLQSIYLIQVILPISYSVVKSL